MPTKTFLIHELFRRIFQRFVENKSQYVKNPGKDFTRKRKFPFEEVLMFMLTIGHRSLNLEILDETTGFNRNPISTSAFIQQRDKLLPELFIDFFFSFTHTIDKFIHYKHWYGYRVLAIDGSKVSLPYNETEKEFQNKKETACAVHLHVLLDVVNNVAIDAAHTPEKNKAEARTAAQLIDRLYQNCDPEERFLLIGDRGYESYNLIAHCVAQNVDFLIRVKDVDSKGISRRFDLPDSDTFDVEIKKKISHNQAGKPDGRRGETDYIYPSFSSYDYPEDIEVSFRFIRFIPEGSKEPILLVTNVSQSKVPAESIAWLYHERWDIETQFNRMKNRLGLERSHSKKDDSIIMEIYAKLFLFNYCAFMILAMDIKVKSSKYEYMANFAAVLSLMRRFLSKGDLSLEMIEASLMGRLQPIKPGRKFSHEPANKHCTFIYTLA